MAHACTVAVVVVSRTTSVLVLVLSEWCIYIITVYYFNSRCYEGGY